MYILCLRRRRVSRQCRHKIEMTPGVQPRFCSRFGLSDSLLEQSGFRTVSPTLRRDRSFGPAVIHLCERQGYFTGSPTALSSVSPLNIWAWTLWITQSPNLEPTTTNGKLMVINAMLQHS